jgi:hypothetical protein
MFNPHVDFVDARGWRHHRGSARRDFFDLMV